jgi:hypothetical protein
MVATTLGMNDPPEDVKEQSSEQHDRCKHTAVSFIVSSSEETLLLTRRGEVLVCRHPQLNFDTQPLSRSGNVDSKSCFVNSSDDTNEIIRKLSQGCLNDSEAFYCEKKIPCDCDNPSRSAKIINESAELQYPASTSIIINSSEQFDSESNLTTSDAAHGNHHLEVCASSEEVEETLDTVEVNDMFLSHDYFCQGNGSPTPVKSFDYNGYEPPTPEPIRLHDRFSYPKGSANHSYHGVDHTSRTNRTMQIKTGSSGCDVPPLPTVSDDLFALPGVPTFLHHLSQIRVTSLAAHPRGCHVLLISEEGLLFSYGSNEFGQLGLGNQSMETNQYHPHPTIVTPLLENGGKTINCAAGIDYSLVVVMTEGSRRKRLHQQRNRQQFNPIGENSSHSTDECDAYHQMYGFGNNDSRKLGLLDPNRALRRNKSLGSYTDVGTVVTASNCVFLPRRVALHCGVHENQSAIQLPALPPYGIFSIAASIDNSSALVRRPSGVIELFTWGMAVPIPTKQLDLAPAPLCRHNGDVQSRSMPQLARGKLLNEISGGTSFGPINQVVSLPQSNSELCHKLIQHVHSNHDVPEN